MAVIKRSVRAGLRFHMALFDSSYFAAKLTNFLESLGKSWILEAKSYRRILVIGKWLGIVEYKRSLSPGNMVCFTTGGKHYFTEIIVTTIKKIGGVRIVVSMGMEGKKFFVINLIRWKPKKIMETYLRRWDRDHAQGDQSGLGRENLSAGVCRHCQHDKAEPAG